MKKEEEIRAEVRDLTSQLHHVEAEGHKATDAAKSIRVRIIALSWVLDTPGAPDQLVLSKTALDILTSALPEE
jgi:hypothetical protein